MSEKNLSNSELYEKLEALLGAKTDEIKTEIKTINNTLLKLDNKQSILEKRIIDVERRLRKNNIIIFGLEGKNVADLQNYVIGTINKLLQIELKNTDINNIYQVGRKNTVIVEFISYLRKQLIFNNIKKLKGSKITITNDLCPEDRSNSKILYENLKEARQSNLTAFIKKGKLYVNNEEFSVDQLKRATQDPNVATTPEEEIVTRVPKPNSAPPTTIYYSDTNFPPSTFVNTSKPVQIQNPRDGTADVSDSSPHPPKIHAPRDGLLKPSRERKNSSGSEGRSLRNKKN